MNLIDTLRKKKFKRRKDDWVFKIVTAGHKYVTLKNVESGREITEEYINFFNKYDIVENEGG